MCASSATTTSNLSVATLPSRSQVVTHQRSPPSPKPAIDRAQCGIVMAAGRSAITRTVRTGRCSATALTARIAVPVLPTPGSSPSRKTRPPAAAWSAIASAPSHCCSRGVSGRAIGNGRGFSLSSSSRKRSNVYGGGSYGASSGGSSAPTQTCACRPGCHWAPGAGARNGTASTHTRSPGPAVGSSSAGFAARFGVVVRRFALVVLVVLAVVLLLLVLRRRRPGMGLPLVLRHGKRRHRRNL